MKKRLVLIVLFIVLAAAIFTVGRIVRLGRVSKLVVEDRKPAFRPAPDFTLFDIHGNETTLADFKGKIVILDFWTTWCPPCKAEIPHFIELYDEYRDEGLEIIGVALDWNAERVIPPFVEEHGITYTILLGDRGITDLYGGIVSIPTTFIIDHKGRIRERFIGYRDKAVFEKAIKGLL